MCLPSLWLKWSNRHKGKVQKPAPQHKEQPVKDSDFPVRQIEAQAAVDGHSQGRVNAPAQVRRQRVGVLSAYQQNVLNQPVYQADRDKLLLEATSSIITVFGLRDGTVLHQNERSRAYFGDHGRGAPELNGQQNSRSSNVTGSGARAAIGDPDKDAAALEALVNGLCGAPLGQLFSYEKEKLHLLLHELVHGGPGQTWEGVIRVAPSLVSQCGCTSLVSADTDPDAASRLPAAPAPSTEPASIPDDAATMPPGRQTTSPGAATATLRQQRGASASEVSYPNFGAASDATTLYSSGDGGGGGAGRVLENVALPGSEGPEITFRGAGAIRAAAASTAAAAAAVHQRPAVVGPGSLTGVPGIDVVLLPPGNPVGNIAARTPTLGSRGLSSGPPNLTFEASSGSFGFRNRSESLVSDGLPKYAGPPEVPTGCAPGSLRLAAGSRAHSAALPLFAPGGVPSPAGSRRPQHANLAYVSGPSTSDTLQQQQPAPVRTGSLRVSVPHLFVGSKDAPGNSDSQTLDEILSCSGALATSVLSVAFENNPGLAQSLSGCRINLRGLAVSRPSSTISNMISAPQSTTGATSIVGSVTSGAGVEVVTVRAPRVPGRAPVLLLQRASAAGTPSGHTPRLVSSQPRRVSTNGIPSALLHPADQHPGRQQGPGEQVKEPGLQPSGSEPPLVHRRGSGPRAASPGRGEFAGCGSTSTTGSHNQAPPGVAATQTQQSSPLLVSSSSQRLLSLQQQQQQHPQPQPASSSSQRLLLLSAASGGGGSSPSSATRLPSVVHLASGPLSQRPTRLGIIGGSGSRAASGGAVITPVQPLPVSAGGEETAGGVRGSLAAAICCDPTPQMLMGSHDGRTAHCSVTNMSSCAGLGALSSHVHQHLSHASRSTSTHTYRQLSHLPNAGHSMSTSTLELSAHGRSLCPVTPSAALRDETSEGRASPAYTSLPVHEGHPVCMDGAPVAVPERLLGAVATAPGLGTEAVQSVRAGPDLAAPSGGLGGFAEEAAAPADAGVEEAQIPDPAAPAPSQAWEVARVLQVVPPGTGHSKMFQRMANQDAPAGSGGLDLQACAAAGGADHSASAGEDASGAASAHQLIMTPGSDGEGPDSMTSPFTSYLALTGQKEPLCCGLRTSLEDSLTEDEGPSSVPALAAHGPADSSERRSGPGKHRSHPHPCQHAGCPLAQLVESGSVEDAANAAVRIRPPWAAVRLAPGTVGIATASNSTGAAAADAPLVDATRFATRSVNYTTEDDGLCATLRQSDTMTSRRSQRLLRLYSSSVTEEAREDSFSAETTAVRNLIVTGAGHVEGTMAVMASLMSTVTLAPGTNGGAAAHWPLDSLPSPRLRVPPAPLPAPPPPPPPPPPPQPQQQPQQPRRAGDGGSRASGLLAAGPQSEPALPPQRPSFVPAPAPSAPLGPQPQTVDPSRSCVSPISDCSRQLRSRSQPPPPAPASGLGTAVGSIRPTSGRSGPVPLLPTCWHRVVAKRAVDPVTGQEVVIVTQDDVTAKVLVESQLAILKETEHRLLEQIYPSHILRHLAAELVAQQLDHERLLAAVPATKQTGASTNRASTNRASTNPASTNRASSTSRYLSGEGRQAANPWQEGPVRSASRPSCTETYTRLISTGLTTGGATRKSQVSGGFWGRPAVRDSCSSLATMHCQVTLLFADIKGFTPMCKEVEPRVVMELLNDLFSRFDALLDKYGVRKVETIGDAYFVAGGLTFEEEQEGSEEGPATGGIGARQQHGEPQQLRLNPLCLTHHHNHHNHHRSSSSSGPQASVGSLGSSGAVSSGTGANSKGPASAGGGGGTSSGRDYGIDRRSRRTVLSSRRRSLDMQQGEAAGHASKVIGFAKAMLSAARHVPLPTTGQPVQIRVGIHTGPVVSGLVGSRMPRFCLFGAAVGAAAKMESTGSPGAVHISEATYRLLPTQERAEWQPAEDVQVKGYGRMPTYLWRWPAAHEQAAGGGGGGGLAGGPQQASGHPHATSAPRRTSNGQAGPRGSALPVLGRCSSAPERLA